MSTLYRAGTLKNHQYKDIHASLISRVRKYNHENCDFAGKINVILAIS